MTLPNWAAADTIAAVSANWDTWGLDRNSLVQGDVRTLDWQQTFPSDVAPVQSAAVAITAPDGVGVSASAADLNWNAGSSGRGFRSYRFVAPATGTATARVAMRQVITAGTVVLALVSSDGTTVLASTACVLDVVDLVFAVSAAVTEGTEYQVVLGANWTAMGGTAQARAYVGKVRVGVAGAFGVFAQAFNRYDAGPAGFTWGDDGSWTAADRAWSSGTTMREQVFDVSTNAAAYEWVDFSGSVDDGASSTGWFVGAVGAQPNTWRARAHSGASPNLMKLARVACGRSATRVSARGVQSAPVRAIYLPAVATTTVAALPTQRLVVYGDSIAAGLMPYGGANVFPTGYSVRDGWTSRLKNVFGGAVFAEAIGGRQFINDGYVATGGVLSTSAGNIALRAGLIAHFVTMGATRVLVEMGTNDWGAGKSAVDFGVAYAAFLDDLHAALPSCVIDCVTMFPRSGETTPNAGGATLPQYRTTIGTVCAARTWVRSVIDGSAVLTGTLGAMTDGVHPDLLASNGIFAVLKAGMGL